MSAGINADSAYNGHRDWQGTGCWSRCSGGRYLMWQGPQGRMGWGGGADRHHGNLISPATPPPPLHPPSPLCPHIRVRGEPAEVKRVYWRLSGDDNSHFKVDGIKFFPFHVATGEHQPWAPVILLFFLRSFSEGGGLSQKGLSPYPELSFPSQLISLSQNIEEGCPLTSRFESVMQTEALTVWWNWENYRARVQYFNTVKVSDLV